MSSPGKERHRWMEKRRHSSSSSSSSSSSTPIPTDIIFDILSRIPVKSLVRFRCVSKLCSSYITDPSFIIAHATHFPIKPVSLLITCPARLQSGQMFFSVDYDGDSAVPLLTVPPRFSRYSTHSVNGLICMDFGLCATICNPSTRQFLNLPFVTSAASPSANSTYFCVNSFGFDPVSENYKVLNSWAVPDGNRDGDGDSECECEYRVLTLGTNSWRRVNGGPPYFPHRESVCVNGIVYFRSWVSINRDHGTVLVAFNLHDESFRVIEIPVEALVRRNQSDLIIFSGRPAIADHLLNHDESITLWVLDNDFDDNWVKLSIFLPAIWQELQGEQEYFVNGIIRSSEILLVPKKLTRNLYVICFDLVKDSMRRIEISGLPEYQLSDLSSNTVSFTNYEENILSFT